jgi:hypothetical protein
LSSIRTFVDNELAFAISLRDFARPFIQRRPIQSSERGTVEVALDDVTNERRLAISMGARQVELTTTINCAIAIVISFTFE